MKKKTPQKKINYLKNIAESLDAIRTSLALIVASNTLVESIEKQEIPKEKEWYIVEDDGKLKTSELLAECKKLFPVWSYYTDEQLDTLCPVPKEKIVKVFRESIEPDVLNMSYNDGIEKGIKFASARDRIILELQYFQKTGKGLDIQGWTITSTLDSDGSAMGMDRLSDGQFCLSFDYRDYHRSDFGLRQYS